MYNNKKSIKGEAMKLKRLLIILLYVAPAVAFTTGMGLSFWQLLGAYALLTIGLIFIFFTNIISFMGDLNFAQGNIPQAIKFYQKAIDKNTKSPTVYLNYAVYLLQEDNATTALDLLRKARDVNTRIMVDKNILLTMSSCLWLLGDINGAIEVLEQLKSKYDYVNANVLTTLGYMYYLNENFDKALEFTNKAIEEEPNFASAWDNLGQIFFKTDEIDKAEEAFLKALSFNNSLVDSNYYLGKLYERKNEMDKANEYFLKAYDCPITTLNSVTKQEIEEVYRKAML